jgi:galactokinase
LDLEESTGFYLEDYRQDSKSWIEYVKGVAWALQEAGCELKGWNGVLAGDVPIGAGLSSSAALELASARAFSAVSALPWDAVEMARLSLKAESEWMGLNCSIMDQMISASGKEGNALLIDCRSLETQLVPLPRSTTIVILDTKTRRGLVDSSYNERQAQCQAATVFFGVVALRDVDMTTFEAKADGLDEVIRRRARHVISENDRVLEAQVAMLSGDASSLGRLMKESHLSLRDDYEVSSLELNVMVGVAQQNKHCFGARMTSRLWWLCDCPSAIRVRIRLHTRCLSRL